jgi:hypothetical protein
LVNHAPERRHGGKGAAILFRRCGNCAVVLEMDVVRAGAQVTWCRRIGDEVDSASATVGGAASGRAVQSR